MRRWLALGLHAGAAGVMTRGWLTLNDSDVTGVGDWIKTQKGGYFLFLTNQGLFITWTYMALSIFYDLFPSVKLVRHVKRSLLMVSMPVEVVVTTIYWSLLSLSPHLIVLSIEQPGSTMPKLMYLPLTTDLALHAVPLLSLLVDFFTFESKYSETYVDQVAPAVVVVFTVWYASFVEYCSPFNGSFPYPFLTHSSFTGRVLIYTIVAGIALGCFRTLNALHA